MDPNKIANNAGIICFVFENPIFRAETERYAKIPEWNGKQHKVRID